MKPWSASIPHLESGPMMITVTHTTPHTVICVSSGKSCKLTRSRKQEGGESANGLSSPERNALISLHGKEKPKLVLTGNGNCDSRRAIAFSEQYHINRGTHKAELTIYSCFSPFFSCLMQTKTEPATKMHWSYDLNLSLSIAHLQPSWYRRNPKRSF